MKGLVFTALSDLVIDNYGLGVWNDLIKESNLPSGGVYTAAGTYDFVELATLVQNLATKIGQPITTLLEGFGVYMFPILAKNYSFFLAEDQTLKEFLKTIDSVIHIEVKKLNPEATLPAITFEDPNDKQLILFYRSPRKLCPLAIGLIKGAAKHFNSEITIQETACMHKGSDHCRLEVTFESG